MVHECYKLLDKNASRHNNNNLLPDHAIHACRAYNIFSDFHNTLYGLCMGGKPVCDIFPKVPVEYTDSSITITAHHFTAILWYILEME